MRRWVHCIVDACIQGEQTTNRGRTFGETHTESFFRNCAEETNWEVLNPFSRAEGVSCVH